MSDIIPASVERFSTDWRSIALNDMTVLESGLQEIGIPRATVKEIVALYDSDTREREEKRQVSAEEKSRHTRDLYGKQFFEEIEKKGGHEVQSLLFIGRLLRGIKLIPKQICQMTKRVPIIRICAPGVPKSKVTYRESHQTTRDFTWEVRVLGTGMGATQTCRVRTTSAFDVVDGQTKQIYLPVNLRVTHYESWQGKKKMRDFLRAEVIDDPHVEYSQGVELVSVSSVDTQLEENCQMFPLAADMSDSSVTYERGCTFQKDLKLSLGIDAFELNTTSCVSIGQQHEVVLTYQLPTGHDYYLYQTSDVYGITWKVV